MGRQRDPEGAAGPDDGRATFVPLAAPGERVRVRIERAQGRVAWGELTAIERPSPVRVTPPCPLFGSCGGCQWQQASIEAQREAKRAIAARALKCELPPTVAAGPPFGYRDRAKLAVGPQGTLGFRARRSHDVVDVPACPLFGPELARALPLLRAVARGLAPGVELEVQAGTEGVHVNVLRADPTSAAHARRELGATAGSIDRLGEAGVVGVTLAGKPLHGRAEVDVGEPGSSPLLVPAGGFAQVGRAANAALVATVMAAVGDTPGTVVELYAGSGNFTRHLLTRAGAVHASDGDPAAVERGVATPRARRGPCARRTTSPPTPSCSTRRARGPIRPHLQAATRARRRIVYVSCIPQTLGRDARLLAAAGFRLTAAVALDAMPQTFHVEVVATFERV